MIRYLAYLVIIIIVGIGVSGCSEEETVSSGTQVNNVASKATTQKVAPAKEEQEEKKEPEFRYVADGRRDPFVPLTTLKKVFVADKPVEPATPLEKYDIQQFKLIGVIVGKGDPKAMVVAPDGKSYVLAKGTRIGKNSGVIIDINGDVVSVKEKYYDFSGNVIENIQEISIPVREGI